MRTFSPETAARAIELEQMLVDFNREIDFNGGAKASTFFSEECVAEVGAIAFKGREGAKKYYADRLESFRALKDGIRTTRHTVANLQISFENDNRATLNCFLVTFGGEGKPPVLEGTAPVAVSDARFECIRDTNGQWHISGFYGVPILLGNDKYAVQALTAR